MNPEPLIFSMSQIKTYVECKKRAQLAYEMLLQPNVSDEAAMSKGTAFHKYAQYQTSQRWPHLEKVEKPEVSEETVGLYNSWWEHRGRTQHDAKKRVLGVEKPIYTLLNIKTGILGQAVYLRCTFDEIYLDKEGWIVGFDYKTYKVDSSPDVDLDFQGRIYIAALQRLFPDYPVRFEYERVRQSAPGTPRGNAQGLRLEEGTWWTYNKAGDKRKRSEIWTPAECYETIILTADQDELDVLWNETLFNATELIVRRRVSETTPGAWGRTTDKFACGFCYFKALCKADLKNTLDDQTIDLLATRRTPLETPEELKEGCSDGLQQT
jgi:hypothetical protein